MDKYCPKCDRLIRQGELVRLTVTVIAQYVEIKSRVTFAIGKPLDSIPESLMHDNCGVNTDDEHTS